MVCLTDSNPTGVCNLRILSEGFGQFSREELPELLVKTIGRAKTSRRMRLLTERERIIAQRRAEGRTFQRIGKEFGLTPESVRDICRRVEDYDRGATMLRDNPASLEALGLVGEVKPSVQHTLRLRGVNQLTDLDGITLDELLSWPGIGKQSASLLIEALATLKRNK